MIDQQVLKFIVDIFYSNLQSDVICSFTMPLMILDSLSEVYLFDLAIKIFTGIKYINLSVSK